MRDDSELRSLLRACTVSVTEPGASAVTGFFIAPTALLTVTRNGHAMLNSLAEILAKDDAAPRPVTLDRSARKVRGGQRNDHGVVFVWLEDTDERIWADLDFTLPEVGDPLLVAGHEKILAGRYTPAGVDGPFDTDALGLEAADVTTALLGGPVLNVRTGRVWAMLVPAPPTPEEITARLGKLIPPAPYVPGATRLQADSRPLRPRKQVPPTYRSEALSEDGSNPAANPDHKPRLIVVPLGEMSDIAARFLLDVRNPAQRPLWARAAGVSESTADEPADQPSLLFRLYIPSARLYAGEASRLLSLFREWFSASRGQGVRQEGYRTADGEMVEFFAETTADAPDVRDEFTSFASFLRLCSTNQEAAVDLLVEAQLEPADSRDRKSTRLNSSHQHRSRMPSSA